MSLLKKETAAAYELVCRLPVFDRADENGRVRVCIAGTDLFCEELFKAMVWSTQREGFRLELDICAGREESERLVRRYPELFHTERLSDSGEIFYNVTAISEAEISGKQYGFALFSHLSGVNSDLMNCAKGSVVLKSETSAVLYGECSERISEIPLDWERFVKESGIEDMALALFCSFNGEKKQLFFENEYYYRSSVASVMFWYLRRKQGLSTCVNEENKMLEHRRWSAFTRTEGYRFGSVRSDKEKLHPCLVAWDMLDRATQDYDAEPIRTINQFFGI